MTNFYVYIWLDPITNIIKYVGKGKDNRAWKFRRTHNCQTWLNELSKNNLKPIVIIIKNNLSEQEAFQLEIETIKKHRKTITNLTDGGDGCSGRFLSEDTKKLISKSLKGKHCSPRTEFKKGMIVSEETKQKLRIKRQQRIMSKETCKKIADALRGKPGAMKGRKFTKEHRQKISNGLKGKPKTEQHKKNMSFAKLNKKVTNGQ